MRENPRLRRMKKWTARLKSPEKKIPRKKNNEIMDGERGIHTICYLNNSFSN
jgi:hypothetical protein